MKKKEYEYIYSLVLDDFDYRLMIAMLNMKRLKQKEDGEDTTEINKLLLKALTQSKSDKSTYSKSRLNFSKRNLIGFLYFKRKY